MHAEDLTLFRAALNGAALPPGVTAIAPDEAARRFAVYRNNVATSLSTALARRFPVIERLVGAEFFAALAGAYRAADPPRQPVLAEWGAGFAGFLAGFPPLAGWPYMADVARIEYARGQAFHAADLPAIDPARLAGADPDHLVLALHPSVIVLRLAHPAETIWAQNQPGASPAPIAPEPQIALILRDRGFDVPVAAIAPADARLIDAIAAGLPLAGAAVAALADDPAHDPQPILIRLMRAGSILAPTE